MKRRRKRPARRRDVSRSVRPSGRTADARTLQRYRREVVALLQAGHRIHPRQGIALIRKWDRFVRASWRQGRPPCNVSDALSKLTKRQRYAGDADNPKKGDVFESRAGARWEVEEVTDKRVKVRRHGYRAEGPFTWGRGVLKGMKYLSTSLFGFLKRDEQEGPPEPSRSITEKGMVPWGDPDRRRPWARRKKLTRKRRSR